MKKFLTFSSVIRIITNGKFKKQIFGFIGNGTSSPDGYEQHKFLVYVIHILSKEDFLCLKTSFRKLFLQLSWCL